MHSCTRLTRKHAWALIALLSLALLVIAVTGWLGAGASLLAFALLEVLVFSCMFVADLWVRRS